MKKDKVLKGLKISEDILDSLVFSSCRYYIGRHTIAAHAAAGELAELLRDNPTLFSKERRQFLAQDIRDRINDVLRWHPLIHIDGFAAPQKPDALVLLVEAIRNRLEETNQHYVEPNIGEPYIHDEFNPMQYKWNIDVAAGKVSISEMKDAITHEPMKFSELVSDLAVWSALAGWLDPYLEIHASCGTDAIDGKGFYIPSISQYMGGTYPKVQLLVSDQETYIKNPHQRVYIADECITSLTTLGKPHIL